MKSKDDFYKEGSRQVFLHPRLMLSKKKLTILTIAFNKPDLIDLQYTLLQQHLKESFNYVVFDNSEEDKRFEIKKICKKKGINYFFLPKSEPLNPSGNPSISHAYALNWAFKNFVIRVRSAYIVILDHDLFVFMPYSFVEAIKDASILAVKQSKRGTIYPWPGLFVMKRSILKSNNIDFMPTPGLDTGAKLSPLLKKYAVNFTPLKNQFLAKTSRSNKQKNQYQIIDNAWIHIINGSNWAKVKDTSKKDALLKRIISNTFTGSGT